MLIQHDRTLSCTPPFEKKDVKRGLLTLVGILVEMLDSASVEGGRATDDAVDLVTLLDQKLGKVGAVLTSDTYSEQQGDISVRPLCVIR